MTEREPSTAELCHDAIEAMQPLLDAADGMRADLERRGWSPTAAEQIAQSWLMGALASMWTPR